MQEHLGSDVASIEASVYSAPADRTVLGALSMAADLTYTPLVDEVFAAAAEHLIRLVNALHQKKEKTPVAMVGGLWRCSRVREPFTKATGAHLAAAQPALGAARWAIAASDERTFPDTDPVVTAVA